MMTPLFVMCVEPAGFSEMHGGVSAPSCCAFIHRVDLAETTSARKRPGTAGAQLSEAPAVEAEGEENPVQGEAHHAGSKAFPTN